MSLALVNNYRVIAMEFKNDNDLCFMVGVDHFLSVPSGSFSALSLLIG